MSRSVLVVEDNAVNRFLIVEILTPAGFAIEEAASLGEARDRLEREDLPGPVLMDMNLPDGHGLDLVRELRADPRTRALPIAALTANAMAEDERVAVDSGCDVFLTKPLDLAALVEAAERLTAGAG